MGFRVSSVGLRPAGLGFGKLPCVRVRVCVCVCVCLCACASACVHTSLLYDFKHSAVSWKEATFLKSSSHVGCRCASLLDRLQLRKLFSRPAVLQILTIFWSLGPGILALKPGSLALSG